MIVVAQRETREEKCHKRGHFATVCQTKDVSSQENLSSQGVRKKGKYGVNSISDSTPGADSDNDEYAFTVDSGNIGGMVTVQLGAVSGGVLIDYGASTNVIDKRTSEELKSHKANTNPRNAIGNCMVIGVMSL